VEDEPNPNLPTTRQAAILRPPSPRHRAERVRGAAYPHTRHNTVAMPWVDFDEDIAAIHAGEAVRDGNRFVVNGREYVLEGEGRLYPTSGAGLYRLGRGGYRALARYNESGITPDVEAQLDRDLILEEERVVARQIWLTLQEWRRRQR
jgi:hypothetical protein